MMDDKQKSIVPPQEKIEELSDAQLSQANGGLMGPTIPCNEKPGGLKLGQAVKKPTCFGKSGDRLPSDKGF